MSGAAGAGTAGATALPPPLAGRECGACSACCTHLRIEDPALVKPDGVRCTNLTGAGGCGIYARRPGTCARWHCGWRLMNVADALRPDRCGVLMVPELCAEPGLARGGLRLAAIGDDPDVLLDDGIVDFAARCVAGGVPVFLSFGDGASTRRVLVNPETAAAVRAGDRARFRWMLHGIAHQLAAASRPAPARARPPEPAQG